MGRVVNVVQVIFWTSVPAFAVYLAVSWALGAYPFGWLSRPLWVVVLFSSTFLTSWAFSPVPGELAGARRNGPARRGPEAPAYPVVLFLAVYIVASQTGFPIF